MPEEESKPEVRKTYEDWLKEANQVPDEEGKVPKLMTRDQFEGAKQRKAVGALLIKLGKKIHENGVKRRQEEKEEAGS
jgi:hypothetical protein